MAVTQLIPEKGTVAEPPTRLQGIAATAGWAVMTKASRKGRQASALRIVPCRCLASSGFEVQVRQLSRKTAPPIFSRIEDGIAPKCHRKRPAPSNSPFRRYTTSCLVFVVTGCCLSNDVLCGQLVCMPAYLPFRRQRFQKGRSGFGFFCRLKAL